MSSSFEDLLVWQRSMDVAVEVCRAIRNFPEPSLKDQMLRASISIPSNIAEGAERFSPKEFHSFLGYAKGSAGELRAQIIISQKLGYISETESTRFQSELREISSMLYGLAKSLDK